MIIPQFKEPGLTKFLVDLDRETTRQQQNTLSALTANRSVLLYSPNKSVFELTVDDAGALHITKVAG
jgi:hypothetical protein